MDATEVGPIREQNSLNYLDYIDWHNHDGVNLSMINDYVRNQFYDNIIRNNVKDKKIIDIGFGTGLLSMLCLKHGADHVIAFEADSNRFLLGQDIIDSLSLAHKIKLINKKFNHQDLEAYQDYTVVTETVNGNLWQEGLYYSLPRLSGQIFLPGSYFLDLYCISVPTIFAQGLGQEKAGEHVFNPGIDIDQKFVSLINRYINKNYSAAEPSILDPGINNFEPHVDTAWGWIPHLRTAQLNNFCAGYQIDVSSQQLTLKNKNQPDRTVTIDFEQHTIDLQIKNYNPDLSTVLVVPRVGMRHDNYQIYLDQGHWGPTMSSIIINGSNETLTVKHSLIDGEISYELESP